MSQHFSNTDEYAADVDKVWAMLSDQSYSERKYEALGAINVQWNTFEAGEDAITISSVREVEANLPGFAKKVIGERAVVTQTEKWKRVDGALACEVEILTKGAPGGITGPMTVDPSAGGTKWNAELDIKVGIPLMGGKFEKLALEETKGNFVKEKAFNEKWLSEH